MRLANLVFLLALPYFCIRWIVNGVRTRDWFEILIGVFALAFIAWCVYWLVVDPA